MSEPRPARDIAGLAAWTSWLLLAQAALAALAVAVALAHGPGFIDNSPAYGLVALLQMLAFLVAGAVFLRWTYVSSANAHAFGAQGLRYGPGLATGSYFIPVANLAMPLQSLRDVWKASVEPRDWEIVAVPVVLGFWWFFWLSGNIAGMVAFRLADGESYPDIGQAPETLTTLSDGLTIAASLLLVLIVRRLSALQQARLAAHALA